MEYLRESGKPFKFLQALNGKIACIVAEKRRPDLIIMDWEMPEMNGYEALVELKRNQATADIPVVMATGRSSGEDLGKALDAGAADYIRKPIDRQELLARVHSCLNLSNYIKEIKKKNEELLAYDHMVSHDLKGPIGLVFMNAEMLQSNLEYDSVEEQKETIQEIVKYSKSSVNLINSMLEYAASERKEALSEEVDLNSVINEAMEAHSKTIREKSAKVNIGTLPVIDQAVPVKVYQLFYNLIGNALKFQKEGNRPVVDILSENGSIIVEDNGIGFDDEQAVEIFKPLKRLDNKYEGFGIGLGTVKRVVDFHGWSIKAEGKPGEGAKFIVSISPS